VFGGEFEEDWPPSPITYDQRKNPLNQQGKTISKGFCELRGFCVRSSRSAVAEDSFSRPERAGLPPLSKYATLQLPGGGRRLAGYTEASRGCRHLCRHCPVVPIYEGQFPRRAARGRPRRCRQPDRGRRGAHHVWRPRLLQRPDPSDADRQRAARRSIRRSATTSPIKVEHLPAASRAGAAARCDRVRVRHQRRSNRSTTACSRCSTKGHTRAGFVDAVALCRDSGVTLAPTFVAVSPVAHARGVLRPPRHRSRKLDLVEQVAPIQLAIRLLVPEGSRLLALDEMRAYLGGFDAATLAYRWAHPDPRVDALQREVIALVGRRLSADRGRCSTRSERSRTSAAGVPRGMRTQGPPALGRRGVSERTVGTVERNPMRAGRSHVIVKLLDAGC
jgi:hypothetical protein